MRERAAPTPDLPGPGPFFVETRNPGPIPQTLFREDGTALSHTELTLSEAIPLPEQEFRGGLAVSERRVGLLQGAG
jgi:hypothetical protein